ncbi:hypothetical protein EDF81_0107 [Enterobacter sp. BIGb0383]|uniref:hypothetical protein n=1 Tax=unclassified Enterobacter TaxID=2608935 RepID=UPI000FAC3F93|nr:MULTISPECIES: hypothetical protein [unclassified Enterobacter]ROP61635.1 hypothetical protein EDF81_0107 [Enterobacter sp. BIGb0383]ROS11796.1 hypothetical protein EC848_0107 [Enterobacter sp. BIGb0359]
MDIYFDFFTDAGSSAAKEKVARRVKKLLDVQYGDCNIGCRGDMRFLVRAEAREWPAAVVEIIAYAQTLGRQWIITGAIHDELDLWSNHATIVGITSIGIVAVSGDFKPIC